jgi:hypothetical protein
MSNRIVVIAAAAAVGILGFLTLRDGHKSSSSQDSAGSFIGPIRGRSEKSGSQSHVRTPASRATATQKISEPGDLRNIAKVPTDFKGEQIALWAAEVSSTKNPKVRTVLVRGAMDGFKGMSPRDKRMFLLQIAQGMMNVNDPTAKRFINDLARNHASQSNLLLNLLALANPDSARADYPELLAASAKWVAGHREYRIEPSIGNLKLDNADAMRAIEGSKFVALDVSSFKYYLRRIR